MDDGGHITRTGVNVVTGVISFDSRGKHARGFVRSAPEKGTEYPPGIESVNKYRVLEEEELGVASFR